jgi:hypothetical protein
MLVNRPVILISCGMTPFAQKVGKSIKDFEVVFVSSDPLPLPLQNHPQYRPLPAINSSIYVHEVLKLCLDLNAVAYLPLNLQEAKKLVDATLLFEEYGIRIWTNTDLSDDHIWQEIPPSKQCDWTLVTNSNTIDQQAFVLGVVSKGLQGQSLSCFACP